ncbi:hypothetical protein AV530_019369 [Patagioenas fasciata monilis]|uniref:Uncharacterized protein n=1 Tax=Patagioenas fasciata monilis TaxID=372326 RepID=A0A1V4JCW6_PATFA|nr:hypothetical protein AV530_019369 [Patagioenas fasciata monilis]
MIEPPALQRTPFSGRKLSSAEKRCRVVLPSVKVTLNLLNFHSLNKQEDRVEKSVPGDVVFVPWSDFQLQAGSILEALESKEGKRSWNPLGLPFLHHSGLSV